MVVGWENKTNKKNMTDWKTNRTKRLNFDSSE